MAITTAGKAEILRLLLPVPQVVGENQWLSWGLSLGYSLLYGMQHYCMLGPNEIDFEWKDHGSTPTWGDGTTYSPWPLLIPAWEDLDIFVESPTNSILSPVGPSNIWITRTARQPATGA